MTNNSIFGTSANDLCHSITLMTRKLCSYEVKDHGSTEFLLSCRLIPLDKSLGIRPIGIGEVLVGKAVSLIVKQDVMNAAGYQQLCAGQQAGVDTETEAFIQVCLCMQSV